MISSTEYDAVANSSLRYSSFDTTSTTMPKEDAPGCAVYSEIYSGTLKMKLWPIATKACIPVANKQSDHKIQNQILVAKKS